ncbi:MAG: HD family phosphohydrolase [Acidobacteriota bacterium]
MTPDDPTDPEVSAERARYRGKVKVGAAQRLVHFLRENEWFWAVAFLLVAFALFTRQFRVQPPPSLPIGSVASRDIRAPFDLQIVDKVATDQKRQEASAKVLPVYDWDSGMAADVVARVSTAFQAARSNLADLNRYLHTGNLSRDQRNQAEEQFLDRLSEDLGGSLSRFALRQFEKEGFSTSLEKTVEDLVTQVEGKKIVPDGEQFQGSDSIRIRDIRRKGVEWTQKNPAAGDIITLSEARRIPGTTLESLTILPSQLRGAIEDYVRGILAPNLTYNSQETTARKEQAAEQVEPLVVFLRKGQVLVKAGEKIDESALQKIQAFQEASRNVLNVSLLGALLLFLLLLLGFNFMYLKSYRKKHYPNLNLFVLTLQVTILFILIGFGIQVLARLAAEGSKSALLGSPELLTFAIPAAAGAMLMTFLVDRHIAIIYTLMYGLLFGIYTDLNFGMLVYCVLSSFTAIYAASRMAQRTAQWKACLLLAAVNVPLALAVLAMAPEMEHSTVKVVAPLTLAFLSAFPLTMMLVSTLLPIFESLFGILTEVRLLELSNMNHPLLRRLALDAPGTYNHSLMMASLSEAAANAIGANALYCRVACYYHDIGKMLNPIYFVENQVPGQNPHDKLAPRISALIVGAHVKEGIAMGRQYKLPQAVIDIIPQHHGTRRISYFLDKALTMLDPEKESINEADFSYPGPKPQSREAAIVMIADGVEAGSRVLKEPSHHRLRSLIAEIANRVVGEDQLSECPLTFHDLTKVQEAFFQMLLGVFSRRISYPGYSFDKEQKNDATRGPASQPTADPSRP